MTRPPCAHAPLGRLTTPQPAGAVTLLRCDHHSGGGLTVWTWGPHPRPGCPCRWGERFLVAEDHGPRNRWQLADVARLAPRRTVDQAVTLADTWLAAAPGCALVTVPVRGWATVFRTRDEGALALHARGRPRECGLCVHPWLAQGHRLRGLAQRAGFGGESRVS